MSEELCPLCGKEYWSTECPHDFQEMQEKIATLQRKLDIAKDLLIRLEIATNLTKSIYESPLHAFNAVHEEILKAQAVIEWTGEEKK